MARKKIVFIIVEGPSDETALGAVLTRVFDRDFVHVEIVHGDITTKSGNTPQNIIAKVAERIKEHINSNPWKKTDFKEIIHIVDTDAVYIPPTCIIKTEDLEKLTYEDDGIHTPDVEGIKKRNKQKTDNLLSLRRTGKIYDIPYRVFYMSCNLDHVLYDKRNSSDDEKEQNALSFAIKYRANVEGFKKFICDSDFSVADDFKESWDFIEKGMNSICRYTNLGICLRVEHKTT